MVFGYKDRNLMLCDIALSHLYKVFVVAISEIFSVLIFIDVVLVLTLGYFVTVVYVSCRIRLVLTSKKKTPRMADLTPNF